MRPDVEDFYSGISFDACWLLGAHPAGAGRGWLFAVWAPHARRVQVLGDWNGWSLYSAAELAFCEDGLWRGRAPQARQGQLYKYNILGQDGVWRLRPDPFAFAFEALPGTASRLTVPQRACGTPLRRGSRRGEPLLIYELHAGSWRRHWDGRYYTGAELAQWLVPYLLEHRYTHVELLPLAEYPFDGSWGYQGSGFFAPTQRIGGLAGFCALADALHAAGLGILADFVPGHFAPDEGRMARFDGAPLWEAGSSDWGSLCFALGSAPVRSFLLSAAAFWLHVCGCDGLRVDAIGRALNRWGGQAQTFFQTLTAGLHARFPGALLIAEDCADGVSPTAPTACGGLGFDYVWDIGWTRAALDCLAAPFDARRAPLHRLAAAFGGVRGQYAVNAVSHDDCAPDSIWAQMRGDDWQKFAQVRLLLLMQAARPGKALTFAGTEFGQPEGFTDGREPDWSRTAAGDGRALGGYAGALNGFVRCHPALFASETPDSFAWAVQDVQRGVLAFWRYGGGEALLCAVNLSPQPQDAALPGSPPLRLLFDTGEAPRYADGALHLPAFGGGVWGTGERGGDI